MADDCKTKLTKNDNKMQSETADFAPSAAISKHTSPLWLWPILSIMWKHDVIHKTGSSVHSIIVLSSEKDRATATGNMIFEIWEGQANRQTDRQTRWLQCSAPLLKNEIITEFRESSDRCSTTATSVLTGGRRKSGTTTCGYLAAISECGGRFHAAQYVAIRPRI